MKLILVGAEARKWTDVREDFQQPPTLCGGPNNMNDRLVQLHRKFGLRGSAPVCFLPGEPEPPLLSHRIGKLNRPALLTPPASESHFGVHQGGTP
jgi:hypothetical protein